MVGEFFGASFRRVDEVVVEEFFTGINDAQSVDKDAVLFFFGRAIGFAGVINPASAVAVLAGIDDLAVIERVVEGVIDVARIVRGKLARDLPRQMFAGVFDDAGARADESGGVNAFAVDAGATDAKSGRGS